VTSKGSELVEFARGAADQHQLGPGTRERQPDGAADAAAGPGYQRNLASAGTCYRPISPA
jgi:hypothetical protein